MWHKKSDGAIWYQTFVVPKTSGKDMPGNLPDIIVTKAETDLNKWSDEETFKFNIQSNLKDSDYYNDRYKKALYYTRYDLKPKEEWKLEVKIAYPGGQLTTMATRSASKDGDLNYMNEKYVAYAKDVPIKLNKGTLKDGDKITYILASTSCYQDPEKGKLCETYETVSKTVTLGKPIIEEVIPVIKENSTPLECKPSIGEHAFDIVPFADASDGTDLSKVSKRIVKVNGAEIDANEFFAGKYVFGDDADGVNRIDVAWIPNGPQTGCVSTDWVLVHDTKPHAFYKLFGGTYKENRKMTIDDYSTIPDANDQYVLARYPITHYDWAWGASAGSDSDRKMKIDQTLHKEFLYKSPGEYEVRLTVTNSLGRTSDPFVITFSVIPDYDPAIIMTPYSSQIARGEDLPLYYEAVSNDGDIITKNSFEVYYDERGDETYTKLIDSFEGAITSYKPRINKLGKYRIKVKVEEEYGQETFPEFLTAADKRSSEQQVEFEVDNYLPYSDLYTDIPSIRQQVDTWFLLDKNLEQSKINYVNANPITINNQLRVEGIDPELRVWDMHTYTHYDTTSQVVYTGTRPSSNPSLSVYSFCSPTNYCGSLPLVSENNQPYSHDFGYYDTKTESKSVSGTCPTALQGTYDSAGHWGGGQNPNNCPGSQPYSDGDGYSGTMDRTGTSGSACPYMGTPGSSCTSYFVASYSGTATRTVSFWVPNIRLVDDWYGTYTGTISKDIRQPFVNSFTRTTSEKYVIYISDGAISELADFKKAMAQSDSKAIVVGAPAIKTQTVYDYFIENKGQTIEAIIQSIVDYIASHNPPTASQLVLVNESFQLFTSENDVENDPIVKRETMYVHNESYFDNSMGHASFALRSGDDPIWSNETLRTSFAQTGEYRIFRRVKDRPDTDPAFAKYSYYSNEAETIVRVHRKPIALATLDWTYATGCACYETTWVDQSYDLDHNVSDPIAKGIVERKIRYRKDGGEWFYKIPDRLEPGTYKLEYFVKDLEGVWSDPFLMNFTLAQSPPPQLQAKLKSTDPTFTIASGVPASETVTGYGLWTRYPFSVDLQFMMGSYINKIVPYYTGVKSGSDIAWTDVVTTIPAMTPDGIYPYRIRANGSSGVFEYKDFTVKVLTPIQLAPAILDAEGAATNTVVVGYPFKLTADTTEYPDQTTVIAFKGKSFQRTLSLSGQVSSIAGVGSKQWSVPFTPVGAIPDGTYTFEWTSRTPNGNSETRSLQVQLVNNTPPFGDFKHYTYDANDTGMPIYEGDLVHIRSIGLGDNERDPLTVHYRITDPSGTIRYEETFNTVYPYVSVGPDYRLPEGAAATGTWTIRQSISDGKADPVIRNHTMLVRGLGVQGYVKHTDAWEANRLHYNEKHPNTQRPAHWFWAGEAFVLESTVTDTGSSGTIPLTVKAFASAELKKSLAKSAPGSPLWKGLLREADTHIIFAELPEGAYSFEFTVTYSNGVTKTSVVMIQIKGTTDQYVQVHRIQ
nr:hypothetical protein [Cohnella endophytica]